MVRRIFGEDSMKARIWMALLAASFAIPAPAAAQYEDLEKSETTESSGPANRFGIGIDALLTGLFAGTPTVGGVPVGAGGGASFIYDATQFRIQGLFGLLFIEDGVTSFGLGARFLWVVHSTSRSDLAVGAGIGVSHAEFDGPGDATAFHAEGLVQLRFFVVSNVAIHGGLGLGLTVGDEETSTVLSIGGRLNGELGLSYFFD
jgi:hypothetical protein